MHFGRPVWADCAVDDQHSRGLQKPGDIDFIPAGLGGSWEEDAECHILRLTLDPALLARTAEDLGQNLASVDLRPRLRLRDPGIEAILTAIKAELETPVASEPLYIDHLSHALANRLSINRHISGNSRPE